MTRKSCLIIFLIAVCITNLSARSWAQSMFPDYWFPKFDEEGIDSRLAQTLENKLLWGYIDRTGKFLIPPIYDKAEAFWHECAEVRKGGLTYYIDKNGKRTANKQPSYGANRDFKIIKFEKDLVDATGKKIIVPGARGIRVYPFSEGLAAFRMPLRLIKKFYPENIPERYKKDKEFDRSTDAFGQCGYITRAGRIVISPKFDHAYRFKGGLAEVQGWQQGGYINRSGNYIGIHPCDVSSFCDGLARCSIGDRYFYMDKSGKILLDHLDSATEFSGGRAAIEKDKKWYLIDTKGKRICQVDADKVGEFSEGLAPITKNHMIGFIDKTGAIIIPPKFEAADEFWDGLAPVAVALTEKKKLSLLESKKEWTCGFIDRSGNFAVKPRFRGARFFSEGLAPVRVGLKWGYIDKTGLLKIKPQFDDAFPFSEGLAGVRSGYLWGFIDHTGKFVISPRFGPPYRDKRQQKSVGRFSEGRVICRQTDFAHKYFDREGKRCSEKWPGDFPSEENNFHEGLALVQLRPGCNWTGNAYIDKQDRVVSKVYYARSSNAFSEGLAKVDYTNIDEKEPPKSGFINKKCEFVIAPEYSDASSFSEGLAAVAMGEIKGHDEFVGKWGYIDKSGKKIIDLIYDNAGDFSEGLAAIKIGAKWGVIDKTGKVIVEPKYDRVGKFVDGRALVKLDNKYGYIDQTGKQVIPIKYWLAGSFFDGMALVVFPADKEEDVSTKERYYFRNKEQLREFLKNLGDLKK